jgi:hypothetical protein
LEEKKQIPGLKHLSCRKYSFQVQDDSDSNIRGFFLERYMCFTISAE